MSKNNRTLTFVFSDATKDSYGTILPVDGWDLDRFNKNGIAFYNHQSYGSDPDSAIGTAKAWVKDDKLMGSITFEEESINPKAEKVYQKYLNGTFKGVSVGFIPIEKGKWVDEPDGTQTYVYGRRELCEISCVPLPANKNALRRSLDKIGEESEEKSSEIFLTEGSCLPMEDRDAKIEDEKPENKPEDSEKIDYNTQDSLIIRAADALVKSF